MIEPIAVRLPIPLGWEWTFFIAGITLGLLLGYFLSRIVHSLSTKRRPRSHQPLRVEPTQILTHEIRTPLSLINGSAELLAADPESKISDRSRELIQTIEDNARRAIAMSEDFLTAEKLRAPGFRLHPAQCDIREVVRETAQELRTINDVPIIVTDPGDPLGVEADPTLLHHVVWNLINNAVRHACGNSVTVSSHSGTDHATIEVADNGIGMTPEVRADLTTPFSRTDSSPRAETMGFGLGMSIVADIVDLHGGVVNVDTLTGRGTVMQIVLPLTLDKTRR